MITSVCRSCGAAILWAQTKNGKAMPLDAEPHPEGNVHLKGGVATVMSRPADQPRVPEGIVRYRSHFATCANAAKHRRPK